MGLPSVSAVGGLIDDPSIQFSTAGKAWLRGRLACKDRVRGADGSWTDGDATFIDFVVFGRDAEHFADTASKGDTVMLSGRLQQQSWDDKETGAKRTSYRIVVDEIGVSNKWSAWSKKDGPSRTSAPAENPWGSDEPPF